MERLQVYYNQLFPKLFQHPLQASATSSQTLLLSEIQRGWGSQPQEFNYECEIEGALPKDIKGTFYRNGPGLMNVYGTPLEHPIDGDGMVCAVRLNNGKAHFTSKYVGTDEYNAEKEMQKCLFRGMMGTMPEPDWEESLKKYLHSNESIRMKFKNPSNTNVYYWGGKVLACWESGLPYALDPITLKTLGKDTLGGALAEASCLAAHFRYDVKNNLLVTFSLRLSLSGNTKIYIHEFDENWRIVNQHKLSWENYYYAHDFLLTENYFIFHHSPFYNLKMENVAKIAMQQESPGKLMRYYPEIPSGMILVPRDKSKMNEQKFFECEPFHIYHHINAFEDGDTVKFSSVCIGKDFTMEFDKKIGLSNSSVAPGRVYDFEIDLAANRMSWKQTDNCSCEFPTYNTSRTGREWRYGYLMGADYPHEFIPYQEVIKFDRLQSNRQVWSAREEGGIIGEPVYIPSADNAAEDDGWVVVQLYLCKSHETQFVILDAKNLANGPVARIKVRDFIPYGFHGTFSQEVY